MRLSLRIAITLVFVLPLRAASPQKGTEILWDTFGVGHVYAQSVEDLFYGYGWAQVQSHGDLLLQVYAESRGRAAEYFDSSYLANDRWVWTNRVPQRSQEWFDKQSPEMKAYLAAFAKGINDWAAAHPDMLTAASRRVLPVTAVDPLQHMHRIVHFSYVASPRLANAATGRGRGRSGDANDTPEAVGSNAWAIGPSRSASGKAMLLGNPHLSWGGWQTYYEIQLTAPGIDLYGASQIGFPVLRFVFSKYGGFNQTVNSADGADLYAITTKDDGYVFDGKVLPFETDTHELKIRKPDGSFTIEKLTVRRTVHGPVIRQEDGHPVALRVTALDRPFMIEQYWQMAIARNFKEYEAAVSRLQVPTFNIIYAGADGHIEYLYNGVLPKRSKGDLAFWRGTVPGDTSETLWTEYHTYDELPKAVDPAAGYVHNTNDPPWNAAWPNTLEPAKYPPYIAAVNMSFRAEQSLRMLSQDDSISYDEFLAYKHNTRAELADRILPDLFAAVEAHGTDLAKSAAKVLGAWDRHVDTKSKGAVLFYNWAKQFMGASLGSQAGFAVPYALNSPLTTPRGLKDPARAAEQLDAAAQQTMADHGALDVEWGEVMRYRLDGADVPANGGFGNLGVFRVITFGNRSPDGKYYQSHGETWVSVVEFTERPRAKVLMSYGNSTQPGTKHRTDQLPFLARKELREAWTTRAEVEQHLESKDSF